MTVNGGGRRGGVYDSGGDSDGAVCDSGGDGVFFGVIVDDVEDFDA